MKQHAEILEFYDRSANKGELIFAILFSAVGSSYRKTGARMLIDASGNYAGGISGGCLEDDLRKKALLNLALKRSEIVPYNTSKKSHSPGSNLGCDGLLRVLLHPLDHASAGNPVNALRRIADSRKNEVLITVIRSSDPNFDYLVGTAYTMDAINKVAAFSSTSIQFTEIANEVLETRISKSHFVKANNDEHFELLFEFIQPVVHLVIVGGHRDTIPLVNMAAILGWKTTVCARQNEKLAALPSETPVIGTDLLNENLIDNHTAIVFMSHDFEADKLNLPKVIDSNAFYIGILGPEKRKSKLLNEMGRTEMSAKISGPIGINIGSKSPEEIALATCTEIQLKFSQANNIIYERHIPVAIGTHAMYDK